MSGGRRKDTPRTVTARAMSILATFSQERPRLSLNAISQRTGLSPSTTYRLVGELTEWGALARTADFHYRIGPMLRGLGAIAPPGPGGAPPMMRARSTGATIASNQLRTRS